MILEIIRICMYYTGQIIVIAIASACIIFAVVIAKTMIRDYIDKKNYDQWRNGK